MEEKGLYIEYCEGDEYGLDLVITFNPKEKDLFIGLQLWNIMIGIGFIF